MANQPATSNSDYEVGQVPLLCPLHRASYTQLRAAQTKLNNQLQTHGEGPNGPRIRASLNLVNEALRNAPRG